MKTYRGQTLWRRRRSYWGDRSSVDRKSLGPPWLTPLSRAGFSRYPILSSPRVLVTPPAKAVTSAERTSGTSSMHAAARTRLKEKSLLLTTDHRPPARGWPCQILSSASSGERQSPQQRRAERHLKPYHGRSLATSRGPGFPLRHDYSPFVGSALERQAL